MAKARARVTCKCGAEFWAEKDCRNRAEADSWEGWVVNSGRMCPTCYVAEKKAEREAAKAEAVTKAAETISGLPFSLPELQGSEKQVAWAADLRAKAINECARLGMMWDVFGDQIAGRDTHGAPEGERVLIRAFGDLLLTSSAKMWIEARGKSYFGGMITIN